MSFFWYAMDSLTSQLKAECCDKSVLFLWDLTSTLFLEQYSYWNNCHLFNILAAIFSKFWWIFLEVVVLLCVCSLRVSQWQIKGNLYIDFFFFIFTSQRYLLVWNFVLWVQLVWESWISKTDTFCLASLFLHCKLENALNRKSPVDVELMSCVFLPLGL